MRDLGLPDAAEVFATLPALFHVETLAEIPSTLNRYRDAEELWDRVNRHGAALGSIGTGAALWRYLQRCEGSDAIAAPLPKGLFARLFG